MLDGHFPSSLLPTPTSGLSSFKWDSTHTCANRKGSQSRCCRLKSASRSVVSDCLRRQGLQPIRLLCPWDSPGENTGVGSHSLLQGIFPTQGLNPGLLCCRQMLYRLSYKGSPRLGGCRFQWMDGHLSTWWYPPTPCTWSAHGGSQTPRLKYRQNMGMCTFMGLKYQKVHPLQRFTKWGRGSWQWGCGCFAGQ